MVRKPIAILFMLLLSGQVFSQVICYADYLLRKADYLEKCENKARPQLQCNGQCQMMKKMLAQQDNNQPAPPELKMLSAPELISSRSFFPVSLPSPALKEVQCTFPVEIDQPTDRTICPLSPPPEPNGHFYGIPIF